MSIAKTFSILLASGSLACSAAQAQQPAVVATNTAGFQQAIDQQVARREQLRAASQAEFDSHTEAPKRTAGPVTSGQMTRWVQSTVDLQAQHAASARAEAPSAPVVQDPAAVLAAHLEKQKILAEYQSALAQDRRAVLDPIASSALKRLQAPAFARSNQTAPPSETQP